MNIKLFRVTALAALATAAPAFAGSNNDIRFYNANGCGVKNQNWTSVDTNARIIYDCTIGSNCPNDKIRSVGLTANVLPGTTIKLCDDSKVCSKDDWAIITVHRIGPEGVCIMSLERNRRGPDYDIFYRRKDNLDGKVSRIEVSPGR